MRLVNLFFAAWTFMIGIFAAIGAVIYFFREDATLSDILMLQICAGTMLLISKMFAESSKKPDKP